MGRGSAGPGRVLKHFGTDGAFLSMAGRQGPDFSDLEWNPGDAELRPDYWEKSRRALSRAGLTSCLFVGVDHQATGEVAEGEEE